MSENIQPVVLIILDGFGVASAGNGNAVTSARLPILNQLVTDYPTTTIQASGESVGLSWGEVGNSEVGHLNLGGGVLFGKACLVLRRPSLIIVFLIIMPFYRLLNILKRINQTYI